MIFRRESELAEPVARFLRTHAFAHQLREVPFYEYRMDMYGYSQSKQLTVAVELKLTKWSRAVSQALLYQLCSDLVYIAMPTLVAKRIDALRLQELGLGIIGVEAARCREILAPRLSPVVRAHYRKHYLGVLAPRALNNRAEA